jgi:hypothetical protein
MQIILYFIVRLLLKNSVDIILEIKINEIAGVTVYDELIRMPVTRKRFQINLKKIHKCHYKGTPRKSHNFLSRYIFTIFT